VHGLDEAMGIRHTRLPWVVFIFGLAGALLGLGLQWWTNTGAPGRPGLVPTWLEGYAFRVSGKPLFSLPANIPVTFELTILLAALAAVIGMLAMNGLPRWHQALFAHPRFQRVTSDRFFIVIEAADPRFDHRATSEFLATLGGTVVEPVERPEPGRAPAWIPIATVVVLCLALFPPLLAYKAWVTTSPSPRLHLVQDMDNQDRYKMQQANPAFADHRAMRPPVSAPGSPVPLTVARGDEYLLGTDRHFFEGRVGPDGQQWATGLPARVPVSLELLERGRERFNVYCAPCHGYDGAGNGMVAKRAREKSEIATGWVPPISLQDATVITRPDGHLFNTITNGIRTMPPYGDQIEPQDRWAIVAYLRALQRSQHADVADVPEDVRAELRQR
jgi:mono/diheme cytochrome c family protein